MRSHQGLCRDQRRLPLLIGAALLAVLATAPEVRAQDATPTDAGIRGPRLFISGKAVAEAAPDFASIAIGVSNKAPTTAAAIDATSGAAGRIVAAARSFGIAGRDLQTSYVNLQPVYRSVRDGNGGTEQRLDGYSASNTVTIRVRDLGRLGEFLRTVVDGGANTIGGIDFGLNDPGKLEREALAAAVKDARLQAETVATSAGVKLGRIEEIRYGVPARAYGERSYAARAPAPRAAAAPPVPIEAGSLDMTAEVQVVFAIEGQ